MSLEKMEVEEEDILGSKKVTLDLFHFLMFF